MDSPRSRRPDPEVVTSELLASFAGAEPALAWTRVLVTLRFARVVHAAVKLGIPGALRERPKTVREIATATATDEAALARLLRALSAAGVVGEVPSSEDSTAGERFRLTPAGDVLAAGDEPFAKSLVDFFDPPLVPLDGLVRTVTTGRPAFDERHGMPFYEYLARRAEDGGARFDASMSVGAAMRSHALLAAVDFAGARRIVDVGGGDGTLLASLLAEHPHLRGVVLEGESTAERARARLAGLGLADRIDVVAGDFFASVPGGADVYVLSFVLHNWDDARCAVLLERCREVMDPGAVLLVVEQVRVPGEPAGLNDYCNLGTMELLGGRERTELEYAALLEAAGFRLARATPAPDVPFCVLEARVAAR
jgi:predicted O-methyltransferase YrrM